MGKFFQTLFCLGPFAARFSEPRLVLRLPPQKGPVTGAPFPDPHRGMQMHAPLYASARHKAAERQSLDKKLFSDSAIGAFRCSTGAHSNDTLKSTLQNAGHIIEISHSSSKPPCPGGLPSPPHLGHGVVAIGENGSKIKIAYFSHIAGTARAQRTVHPHNPCP